MNIYIHIAKGAKSMKSDDQEFNYKQNKNNEIKLSDALYKRIKEDRLVSYISLFAIFACFLFILWSLL